MVAFKWLSRHRDRIAICDRVLETEDNPTILKQRVDRQLQRLLRPLCLDRHITSTHRDREGRQPASEIVAHLLQSDRHKGILDRITVMDRQCLHDSILVHDNQVIQVSGEERRQRSIADNLYFTRIGRHAVTPSHEMIPFGRDSLQSDHISIRDRIFEIRYDSTVFQQRVECELIRFTLELSLNRQVGGTHHKRKFRLPTHKIMAHLLRRNTQRRLDDGISIRNHHALQRIPIAEDRQVILVHLEERSK